MPRGGDQIGFNAIAICPFVVLFSARYFNEQQCHSLIRQFQDFDGKRDLAVALCVSHFHAEYVRGDADEFAGDRASQVMISRMVLVE